MKLNDLPTLLSAVKPEYPHLVRYSRPDEPLLSLPEFDSPNEPGSTDDTPLIPINLEDNTLWARAIANVARDFHH